MLAGGFGSAVLEALTEAGMEARAGPPASVCRTLSMNSAPAVAQRHRLQLDAEGIAERVLSAFFPEASKRGVASKA